MITEHVLARRKDLEARELSSTTIRRKLAALSSLFEHLCDANAVTHNPAKGVKRPKVENYEGRTPGLGDGGQAGSVGRSAPAPMPQPEAHNAVVRGEEQVAGATGDAVSAAVEETHLLIGSPVTIAVAQREDDAGIGAVRSRIERNRTKKGKRIGGSKGGTFSPVGQ